jgi:hypothetical protein
MKANPSSSSVTLHVTKMALVEGVATMMNSRILKVPNKSIAVWIALFMAFCLNASPVFSKDLNKSLEKIDKLLDNIGLLCEQGDTIVFDGQEWQCTPYVEPLPTCEPAPGVCTSAMTETTILTCWPAKAYQDDPADELVKCTAESTVAVRGIGTGDALNLSPCYWPSCVQEGVGAGLNVKFGTAYLKPYGYNRLYVVHDCADVFGPAYIGSFKRTFTATWSGTTSFGNPAEVSIEPGIDQNDCIVDF